MRMDKYLRLTIKGDDLNPNIIKEATDLPCDIYIKGESILYALGTFKREIPQKTNRWVYEDIGQDETRVGSFLTKNLETIIKHFPTLKEYAKQYKTTLELIIYAGKAPSITLTQKHMRLLNTMGLNLSICFHFWY